MNVRYKLLSAMSLAIAVMSFSQPAVADDSIIGTGTIRLLSAVVLSQTVDEDGNTIQHRMVTRAITGFFAGTVIDNDTRLIAPTGEISQTGTGMCSCAVADRSGTVVWIYEATAVSIAPGVSRFEGEFEIVSAEGELTGLRGEASFLAEGSPGVAAAIYSGEFDFE